MKKLILEILLENEKKILEIWVEKLKEKYSGNLSEKQIVEFVKESLKNIIKLIENSMVLVLDEYLISCYGTFSRAKLNFFHISDIFHQGRNAILNTIDERRDKDYDIVLVMSFIDEIFERIFARYAVLHQNSELRQLEEDKEKIYRQFKADHYYLQNVLYSTDAAIMTIDKDERIRNWNKGAQEIFGWTEDEVLGKPSSFLMPKEEKYREELKYIIKEIEEKGFVKIDETERIDKQGNKKPVQLNVTKLPSPDGGYFGRTVVIKDTSEVKRLEQQVSQSEKLAVIGQLAAGIAHEIGNPLTAISSLVQILRRKTKDDTTIEYLSNIKENIDRISKIVRELVDFSRTPSYEKELVQINHLLNTALGIVKYDKRVKNVEFITDLSPDLPQLKIVPDQLLQVFINILINALDAMDGEGELTVKTGLDEDKIVINISDTGCGIEEENLDKIFDPFYTTKDVGKGTGLGLSVSYGIINKFKGEISVKSKVGEGTTFTIKLPIN